MTPATLAECRSLAPMSSRELGRFARFDGDGWNFEQRTGQQKTESKTHAASPDPSLNFYVSTPKLVVNQTLYYKNSVSNRDTANTILGPVMTPGEEKGKASSSKHRSNEGPAANLEPEGEHSGPDTQEEAGSASGESYDEQASDWFKRGRYLKIFARHGIHVDREIHEKEFILLDSKNIEGKGVRVDRIEKKKEEDSGWESTTVRLVDPRKKAPEEWSEVASGSAITARSPLFFDAIGPDNREMENRYVRLEHTYNIPFFKYRCKDLGKLKLESLRRLRLRYVEHLMNEWNLVDQVRELLEGQPTQSYPASVRESSRATTPATSLLNVEGVTTSVLRGKKKANPTTSSLS